MGMQAESQATEAEADASPVAAHRAMLEVPVWLVRLSSWAWRLLLLLATILVGGWLFTRLRVVFVPIFIATILASILSPLVDRLSRKRIPQLIATWAVLLGFSLAVVAALTAAGWGLSTELTGDSARWEEVDTEIRSWLQEGPLDLEEDTVAELERNVRQGAVGGATSFGTSRARLLVEFFSGLFLTVALTFFFVKDGPEMWAWCMDRVAPRRRAAFDEAGKEAAKTLGAYMRAVSLTGAINAIVIGIGLLVIGVPLVIPLAVITFFGAFLPVVGATVAGGLAAVVALLTGGPGDAALVIGLTVLVQQIEGDVIMPVVMGRQVPLHPAAVLAALTAGGAVAGVIGAFVAVPVTAVATVAVGVVRRHRWEQDTTPSGLAPSSAG